MKPSPSPAAMTLLTDEQAKAVSEQVLKDNLPYSIKLLAHYILASRGTRALTELGTRIKYKPGGKYPEWERGDFYYAGTTVQLHGPNRGEPNLWVADCWPIQSPGNITDGFSPDEWEPSA